MTSPALVDRRNALTRRLDDGWDRINQAQASGTDTDAWTNFWIDLLREYESTCEEIEIVGQVNARRARLQAATPLDLPVRTIAQVKQTMNLIAKEDGLPVQFDDNGRQLVMSWGR